jgi:hypothetical protein
MQPQRKKDLAIFIQVLQRMHRLQEKYWRAERDLNDTSLSKRVSNVYHSVTSAVCYPLKENELDTQLRDCGEHIIINNLFLPPLDTDNQFIPIMCVDCDFTVIPPQMRLYVGMFRTSRSGKPKVFGFRFETSHPDSNHDYCHGQFTRTFAHRSEEFSIFPKWIPERVPCILVPANDPISLFCVMLISFYGKIMWTKILSDIAIDDKYFKVFRELL